MSDRCHDCDRPRASSPDQWRDETRCAVHLPLTHNDGPDSDNCPMCHSVAACETYAVDWRARALAAEEKALAYRSTLHEAAESVREWQARALAAEAERDALRAEVEHWRGNVLAQEAELDRLRAQVDDAVSKFENLMNSITAQAELSTPYKEPTT